MGEFVWLGVVWVVVAAEGLDESDAAWGDEQACEAVSGAEVAADVFDAVEDVGGAVLHADAVGGHFADGAGSGEVVSALAGGVAEGGGDGFFGAWGAGFHGFGVGVEGGAGADVFVIDADAAGGFDLDVEADEGVDEAEVDGAIEGEVGVVVYGGDVDGFSKSAKTTL